MSDLWMDAQGDDNVFVYADGELVGRTSMWYEVKLMKIPRSTTAIALKGIDTGGKKILGCEMNNFVTDSTWKCTDTEEDDWNIPSHDIDEWSLAKVITPYTLQPTFKSAKGIWDIKGNSESYCVKNNGELC